MGRLNNKVAIITGAGSGIGQATAILFAHEGATVIATDIDTTSLNITVSKIQANNKKVYSFKHDVSSRTDWQDLITFIKENDLKVDVLANIAGISSNISFSSLTDAEWDKVFDVNMKSVFIGVQETIPLMIEQSHGSIINVSSMCGLLGNCGAGPYAASKAALTNFTKSVAHDFAAMNIRCNSVHPGYIATNMTKDLFENPLMLKYFKENTPLPCLGRPLDIAFAIVYLASEESQFITGIELIVDGGIVNSR
ncbi:SDR family NAD(P)-dependent oxidoreductase [Mycoplasma sp. P36-A1]|uniref:SDR family NAD(P)-dependent oxidoreductase n=1 Tax=Mycoplasma sp. P36-A1 TaxID=3252900 RepID=UPI003C30676D